MMHCGTDMIELVAGHREEVSDISWCSICGAVDISDSDEWEGGEMGPRIDVGSMAVPMETIVALSAIGDDKRVSKDARDIVEALVSSRLVYLPGIFDEG
jgi:hypothetical protein